jgi:NADH:ubiquinone oxidoreductase subunit 5 (subunit L)/multisubunit Na+/H+ antiporter MnhA subunit
MKEDPNLCKISCIFNHYLLIQCNFGFSPKLFNLISGWEGIGMASYLLIVFGITEF